jgi:Gly-Xaa carboxypeptidase
MEHDSSEFKLKPYESLGGAVRIPRVCRLHYSIIFLTMSVRTRTESHDDLGLPSEDPQWEIETKLHKYLESPFPKM